MNTTNKGIDPKEDPRYAQLDERAQIEADLISKLGGERLLRNEAEMQQYKDSRTSREMRRLVGKEPSLGERPYNEVREQASANVERFHAMDQRDVQRDAQRALDAHFEKHIGKKRSPDLEL